MFNSDMVLYCMKSLILHGVKPDEIVDPNIRTDFNKLAYLSVSTMDWAKTSPSSRRLQSKAR